MTDYHGFLKNFQSIINAYQDISTIYAKLEAQGHLERIISLLMEIFNEEHEFTLSELQRYGRENNQREEDFLEEQYELNSNIFRRNFTLVIQSLAEEMGKSLLEKFKRFYGQNHKRNSSASKFELNFVDEQKATGAQKPQYKAEMPEIQEEIESTGKISPLKSSPKSGRSGTEFISTTARSFELNIEDLNSRAKFTHDDKPTTPTKTQPDSTATQSTKPGEPSIRQEPLTEVSPLLAQRKNEGQRQPPPKSLNSENLMYVSAEFKQIKENLKSPNSGREGTIEQGPGHYRSISQERTSMGPGKGKANSARGLSPSATNRVPKSATTSISSSKFSIMPPSTFDPSGLDSDFGHIRGSSFGKSERTGLFYPNSVPGPGSYEAEDIMKAVQKRAPTASFPRSPKFSVFDKALNESPGAIYYPSHHFVSK